MFSVLLWLTLIESGVFCLLFTFVSFMPGFQHYVSVHP